MDQLPALSLNEWVVLALLAEGPSHGFALARELGRSGEVGQVWTVHRPLVYRALDRLVAAGLAVETGTEPSGSGPPRTTVSATPEAVGLARRWLEEPVDHVREVRSTLLVKLVLLARSGLAPDGLLRRQRDRLGPVLAALEAQRDSSSGTQAVVATWRHRFATAVDRLLEESLGAGTGSPP